MTQRAPSASHQKWSHNSTENSWTCANDVFPYLISSPLSSDKTKSFKSEKGHAGHTWRYWSHASACFACCHPTPPIPPPQLLCNCIWPCPRQQHVPSSLSPAPSSLLLYILFQILWVFVLYAHILWMCMCRHRIAQPCTATETSTMFF